ncbi:hypothetical protein [Brevibacillus reuszeri]|uniref:hypothetical protein n=1 Tax=Brevibacillus reuszeri TaxID=54915 RepID=UPI000CCC014C|nr:hypothetical protein [Brevibacillus reuszeri]
MNCCIPNTHKRLNEAHLLWHQCLDNYFNPDGFRANLNAAIQALRNLTFALQAEKERINNFDSWYTGWQTKMKSDPVMKWLNEARVQIVHQRDLETESIAEVLVHSYLDLAQIKFSVSPLVPPDLIAHKAKQMIKEKINIPDHQLKECIAVVERKWVVNELPDRELLNALAHGFLFLKEIVIDAHQQAGLDIGDCQCIDTVHQLTSLEIKGRYKCMKEVASIRRENIVLDTYQSRSLETLPVQPSVDLMEKARKRYLSKPISGIKIKRDADPLTFADNINQMAKRVLKRDKYHESILFMQVPGLGWEMFNLRVEDKSDKFIIMKELAEHVRAKKADSIVHVGEAWISSDIEAIGQGIPVSETKNNKEALFVSVINYKGQSRNYITFFNRGYFGNIRYEETVITEGTPANYLNPIVKVWSEMRSEES